MSIDLLLAIAAFAFVASVTPGPNNVMLMASGANFGFRRTGWHMAGIGLGFAVMLATAGAGIVQLFDLYPVTQQILSLVGVLYLLYLAWKIANAGAPSTKGGTVAGKPFTLLQAALFQWVNPKGWTMGLTAVTVFSPDRSLTSVAVIALIFGVVNIPCMFLWTGLGGQIARFLTSPTRLRLFNWGSALLLVASILPVVLGKLA